MRWLTNIYDPTRPDARGEDETREYLRGKFLGEPKATERYSVESLKAMGMVGVYLMESTA